MPAARSVRCSTSRRSPPRLPNFSRSAERRRSFRSSAPRHAPSSCQRPPPEMPLPKSLPTGNTGSPLPLRFPLPLLAIVFALSASHAGAEDGQMMLAPLPPGRPFDLDLPAKAAMPAIVVPPPAAPVLAPVPVAEQADSPPAPNSPAVTEPDEDEGPEWPKLTPGQKAGAEPAFDPDEKPDRPGISTDPGTSTACLPQLLRSILGKIADKYGAVKVTS